jgi:hypothetical protein
MTSHHDDEEEGPVPGLSGYSLDRAPERDLWPGIEARLVRRGFSWRQAMPYAAAAVIVIGMSVHLLFGVSVQSPSLPTSVPLAQVASAAPSTFLAPMREHEPNRVLVKANLKIVDDAERQLENALRSAPDADYLKRLVESTREQRRDLRRLLSRPV